MILLLCAMKEEVAAVLENIIPEKTDIFFNMPYVRGRLGNHEAAAGLTGVGKVMSSMITQKLIDFYKPEIIIFSGIAGAVNSLLSIGDVVVSEDCIQHDMDATSLGFSRGEVPFTGIRIIKADQKLIDIALKYNSGNFRIIKGRILTGDQFIAVKEKKERDFFSVGLKGDAVEMEGASVGFVSFMNNIPFLLIRVISDRADGNAPADFKGFLESSSQQLADIVLHILNNLD